MSDDPVYAAPVLHLLGLVLFGARPFGQRLAPFFPSFRRPVHRLNNMLRDRVNNLSPLTSHLSPCYYVVGFGASGNFTAGGNTFINDIIRMAGGRNIAEDIEGWSYSLEALVQEDPDYIIVRREDSAAFCGMKPYNRLSAVRNGHVIGIVSGTLDLQVPRNIDAILYLRQRMNNQ